MAEKKRGFAAMDPEEQRRIARKGGRASHEGQRKEEEDRGSEENEGEKQGRKSESALHKGVQRATREKYFDHPRLVDGSVHSKSRIRKIRRCRDRRLF